MRRVGAAALLCLLGALAPAPAAAQRAGREVYSRHELTALGIHRLSELVLWLGGGSSVEGIAWSPAPDGIPAGALPRAGLPGWELVIDGQPVPVEVRGAWLPELAPLAALQIDSVVVVRTPGMEAGRFASRGALRIHTRRAAPGASARAWVRHGSETGDPGPYLWTPLATPNVDRTGPDGAGVLAYGGPGWEVEASYRRIKHPVTDPALEERFGISGLPFIRAGGPALRAGLQALGGRHELLAGRTEHEGFVYAPVRGRMELAVHTLTHAGASGSLGLGGTELRYRLARSVLDAALLHEPAASHERETTHASAELSRRVGAVRVGGGASVDDRALLPTAAPEERHREATLFATLERPDSGRWWQRADIAVTRVEGRSSGKAAVSAGWSPGEGRALTASLAAARLLPYEGDAWMSIRSADESAPPPPERTLLRAELGWAQTLGAGVRVEAAGVYGHLRADGPGADELRGGRLGARLALSARPDERLSARVLYASVGALSPSERLEGAAETVPAHILRGWLVYTPVPSFELGGAVLLRSGTRWPAALPGAAGEPVGAVSRVDASARKWIWQRRVSAHLLVRNLLGGDERYHPHGAAFGLRYFVGLGIDLPGDPRGS